MNLSRTAIVVDTPYQIMSALSYVTNHMAKEEKADIYIDTKRCVNYDMRTLYERVMSSGIFGNVLELNSLSSGKFGIRKKIANYYEWLFPKSAIKRGLKCDWKEVACSYKSVVVSGPFMLQRNFINLQTNADVIFIEDGSGSYTGRIGVNGLLKNGERMQKLLHRGPEYISPKVCYLYSPAYYEGEYADKIKKLERASEAKLSLLFDVESTIYEGAHVIYFDQPKYSAETIPYVDDEIIEMLRHYSGVILRPHPQLKKRKYRDIKCDVEGMQWEIVCSKYIKNESVLIGKYSTAQLTPKLLFDIEPIVVFTHRLYGINRNSSIDNQIRRFKKMYRDETRVIICESKEELEKILLKFA